MPTVLEAQWQHMPRVYLANSTQLAASKLFTSHSTHESRKSMEKMQHLAHCGCAFFYYYLFLATEKSKNIPSSLLSVLMLYIGTVFYLWYVCGSLWEKTLVNNACASALWRILLTDHRDAASSSPARTEEKNPTVSFGCPQAIYKQQQGDKGPVWAGICAIFKASHF